MQVYGICKSLNSVFVYTASALLELGLYMERETSYSDKLVSVLEKKSRLYFY